MADQCHVVIGLRSRLLESHLSTGAASASAATVAADGEDLATARDDLRDAPQHGCGDRNTARQDAVMWAASTAPHHTHARARTGWPFSRADANLPGAHGVLLLILYY